MRLFSLIVFCLVSANVAHATSFNCNLATTKIETALCNDVELSQIDDSLAAWYRLARSHQSIPVNKYIIDEQKKWLLQRNEFCYQGEKSCLLASYHGRIATLRSQIKADSEAVIRHLYQDDDHLVEDDDLLRQLLLVPQAKTSLLMTNLATQLEWQHYSVVKAHLIDLNLDGEDDLVLNATAGTANCQAIEVLLAKNDGFESIYAQGSEDHYCGSSLSAVMIQGRPQLMFKSNSTHKAEINTYTVINKNYLPLVTLYTPANYQYLLEPKVPISPELDRLVWQKMPQWQRYFHSKNEEAIYNYTITQFSDFQKATGLPDAAMMQFNIDGQTSRLFNVTKTEKNGIQLRLKNKPETYEISEVLKLLPFDPFREFNAFSSYTTLSAYSAKVSFIAHENTAYMLIWSNMELGWRQSKDMGFLLFEITGNFIISKNVPLHLRLIDSYIIEAVPSFGYLEPVSWR